MKNDPHPFVLARLKRYVRPGTDMGDLIACWRNCPTDDPTIRALYVHKIHSRDGFTRTAARYAIAVLIGDENEHS